ncbi:TetR/AcrR family transcriptional regulator [Amycolatopsis sp. OK19-0408]|uniref:TetR/AcrR family transcriptional regulator n=1 Tax=Amycolatopsis iheyensis TaxID=2945988 RepID=A0A9X2SQ18_9PSEU|nr:TetR/AcrR family transcriptional regulator [Amycolatopsis iheyensis]MCR6488786.1 TetR/AcrR family transcriptional regulator [Amycolatopsis iheyensis]
MTGPEQTRGEGLRERKKRLMRHQLASTAAKMFLERGFDSVRVAEVAEACGVSEKTVFNYFPTKEALVLDRLEGTVTALRTELADPDTSPAEGALRILTAELDDMQASLSAAEDRAVAIAAHRRFGDLIRATPSLRAHRNDMTDRFISVAAEVLAARAGCAVDDPEPQIVAAALIGLWRVQFYSLRRHLHADSAPEEIHRAVMADVRRAAELIEPGLGSFSAVGVS